MSLHAQAVPRELEVEDEEADYMKQTRPDQKGEVVNQQGDVVVLKNLDHDAPRGCWLEFEGGAQGVLMWRREPLCFAYMLDGASCSSGVKVKWSEDRAGVLTDRAMWGAVVNPLSHIT
ncbi:hypothetical protein CYMTET_9338, partial [Cymbomonas tetramitiformis]